MAIKSKYVGKDVFMKESTTDAPFFCLIKSIHRESGIAFYEVESNGDCFSVAVEAVQWIKLRKDMKIADITALNCRPLTILIRQ